MRVCHDFMGEKRKINRNADLRLGHEDAQQCIMRRRMQPQLMTSRAHAHTKGGKLVITSEAYYTESLC
jgi:hypothetical protein